MLNFMNYGITRLGNAEKAIIVKPNWYSEMQLGIKKMMKHKGISGVPNFLTDDERQQLKDIQTHIKEEYEIEVGNLLAPTVFCLSYLIWLRTLERTHEEDHLKEFTLNTIIDAGKNFTLDNYNETEETLKKVHELIYVDYEDLFIDCNTQLDITKEEIKKYTTDHLEISKKIARMAGDYDMIDELDNYSVRVHRG